MAAAGDLPRPGLLRLSQDNLLLNADALLLGRVCFRQEGQEAADASPCRISESRYERWQLG